MQVNRRFVVRVLLIVVGLASLLQAVRTVFGAQLWTLLLAFAAAMACVATFIPLAFIVVRRRDKLRRRP